MDVRKSWLIGKDSDAGRDWGQEEKGTTEIEMAGWHHWLDGVGDGQGGLACCDSWGHRESDTTERLNWSDTFSFKYILQLELCWLNFCNMYSFKNIISLCIQLYVPFYFLQLSEDTVDLLLFIPNGMFCEFWFWQFIYF